MEKDFLSESRAANFQVSRISLRGQFHTSANRGIYDTLKSLCDQREEFYLPCTKLHRNRSAGTDSWPGIEIAFSNIDVLDAILISRCDWASSIAKAVLNLPSDTSHTILEIGLNRCIPTKLANDCKLDVIPGVLFNRGEITVSHRTKAKVQEDIAREQPYGDDAIAIIGMGCRFPGSDSVEQFWDVIKSGISTLSPFPESRFKHSKAAGKGDLVGNFIREPEVFDHKFFNISPREAAFMDPQQRLTLQVAYEALQSSGYFRNKNPASKNIGCYLGVAAVEYQDNVDSNRPGAFSLVGTVRAFISARVSHHFGWTGPSLTFDTACSSSLVAIHQACKDIRSGDCDTALAGGVNIITSPFLFNALGAANFTSRTSGPCKPFDENADGYCRGEGCGLIVLKRLSLALEQNDKVLAVIPSSAINQSENLSSITVPHSDSQVRLFQQVVNRSGVAPNQVTYLEAHGTGTPKGDPIEMESIRRVFGVNRNPNSPLVVGSVKGNIGHLEAASGAAALIKTVLMIQEKTIPPLANFKLLNPSIGSLQAQNIEIAVQSRPWNTSWRAACISNYGAAGSNACVLICQPPSSAQKPARLRKAQGRNTTQTKEVFHVSAQTEESLKAYCRTLNTYIASHNGPTEHFMSNLAFNLAYRHNPDQPYSVTVSTPWIADLKDKLLEIASNKQDCIFRSKNQRKPVVLCFGGQRRDYIALSNSVYENCALLRYHLRCCEEACARIGSGRVFPHVFDKTPISNLVDLHCCIFAVQYSCARAWLDSGLTVDALVGHSFGQLTALCISGALSLQDTLLYISKRAELIQSLWGPEKGTMLSVDTDKAVINQVISAILKQGLDVQVACYNTPTTYVLSGAREPITTIERFIQGMQADGKKISCRMLSVTHGYHSRLVDAITPELAAVAKVLDFHAPTIPVEFCDEKQFQGTMTAEELASHSQRPVFFTNAISRLADRFSSACWIEAGSDSGIITLVKRNLATESPKSHHVYIPMPLQSEATLGVVSDSVASLLQAGVHVRHWAHHTLQNQQYDYLKLPCYQFEKPRHWLEYKGRPTPASSARHVNERFQNRDMVHLISNNNEQGARFGINTNADDFVACTKGHAVLSNALCPASLYIEMATRAAKLLSRDATHEDMIPQIENLQMSSPLSMTSAQPVELHLTRDTTQSPAYTFRILGNASAPTDKQVTHAEGTIVMRKCSSRELLAENRRYKRLVDLKRCQQLLDNTEDAESIQGRFIYDQFRPLVDYAPCYRGIRRLASLDGNVAGLVHMHSSRVAKDAVTHPLAVDNFTQVAGFCANVIQNHDREYMFLCTAIGRISMYSDLRRKAPAAGWLVFCTIEATPEKTGLESDIYVLNPETGMIDAILLGAQFAKVRCSSFRRLLESRGPHIQARKLAINEEDLHGNTSHGVTKTETKIGSLKATSSHTESNARDGQLGNHYFEIVQEIIAEVMQVPLADILMTSNLIELGIDSLVGIELLTEISSKIGTTLSAVDFASLETVGDLSSMIKSTCADKETTLKPLVNRHSKHIVQCESADALLVNGTSTHEDFKSDQHERVDQTISVILSELLDLAPDAMTPSLHLDNAGLDSLLSIELCSEIERRLDVKIHSSELISVTVASDLIKLVQDRTLPNGQDRDHTGDETCPTIPTQLSSDQNHREYTHTIIPVFSQEGNTHEITPSLIASPGKIFASVQPSFPQLAEQTNFAGFFEKVYPTQRDLVVSYVVEALSHLGCSLAEMRPDTPIEIPRVVYELKHSRLVPRLVMILEEAELVYTSSRGLSRSQKAVSATRSSDLYQELLSAFPAFTLEHRLLNAMGSKLGAFLTGKSDPLHILFGENKQLSADVYAASPLFATPTHILSAYLAALFDEVRRRSHGSTKPVIRILELGAGTGGTTAVVLDMLEKFQDVSFEYTFTDISTSLLHHAKRRFSSHRLSSNIVYSIVDIESEPPASLRSSFDIVFASNCIHATRSLRQSCSHIRMMLRPGGIMCLIELMRPLGWLELIYGLLDGWWRFDDERQYPLVSEVYWKNVLREAGFKHVDWSGKGGEGLESTQIRVLLGCAEEQDSVKNQRLRPVKACKGAVMETIRFACIDGVELFADIYYPKVKEGRTNTKVLMEMEKRPVGE
jgi:acyl transferase domain-containing protein/acyl carrier protein/SAM-dependent methyltransferase